MTRISDRMYAPESAIQSKLASKPSAFATLANIEIILLLSQVTGLVNEFYMNELKTWDYLNICGKDERIIPPMAHS